MKPALGSDRYRQIQQRFLQRLKTGMGSLHNGGKASHTAEWEEKSTHKGGVFPGAREGQSAP